MSKEIIDEKEKLAELCHKQWSGWIKYMFGKCLKKIDGTILIPEWAVTRWRRQAYTPYQKLSHKEKESDRTEADRFLALLKQQPTAGDFTKIFRADCEIAIRDCNISEEQIQNVLNNTGLLGIKVRLSEGRGVGKKGLEVCDRLDRAESELKAKDEIIFAYESVHAPINPLLAINKDLLELCKEFMLLADNGSAAFDDPEPGSIYLRAEAIIAKAKKVGG